jgi:hypothetical protein
VIDVQVETEGKPYQSSIVAVVTCKQLTRGRKA